MVGFKNFLQKTHTNVSKFFNSTLPSNVRNGVRYFNSHVVPAAQKVHRVHGAITKELSTNPNVHKKVSETAKKSSAFADLGLSRLTKGQEAINRVAGELGVA